jgi:hypothetical protein
MKNTVFFIVLLNLFLSAFAQCPNPNEYLRADTKNGWGKNSQSKSGYLKPGETYELNFIAQRGMEYRITVLAGNDNFSSENLNFQLYHTQVEKVEEKGKQVYKRLKSIIFDSNEDEGEVKFATDQTRKISLEVSIENYRKPQCVIVFIESRKSKKLGFK